MLEFTYHPSNDPYHCAFRTIQFLECDVDERYSVEEIRIFDFYLLFPSFLKYVRKTRPMIRPFNERGLNEVPEPYQKTPSQRLLFRQLEGVQRTAYRHLAAIGVLELNSFKQGIINYVPGKISKELRKEIKLANEEHGEIVSFILEYLAKLPLYGPNGLKARTGLMEFRYDAP